MTSVLKVVVVVTLVAAAKRCNGRAVDSDGTSNEFQKFWGNLSSVLRVRSTGWNFGSVSICTWYQPKHCNVTGVTLAKWIYFIQRQQKTEESRFPKLYWEFGANNSMRRYDGSGLELQYLLYRETDSSCGVIEYHYYTLKNDDTGDEEQDTGDEEEDTGDEEEDTGDEEDDTTYEQLQECINESDSGRCKDEVYYDLFVSETTSDVPKRCDEFYTTKKGVSPDTRIENIDDCKPKQE